MLLLLFQEEAKGFERYLDKYGWPTLMLVIVLLAIRASWPFVTGYIKGLQKSVDDAFVLMRERLDTAESRAETAHTTFLAALDAQRQAHEAAMKAVAESHMHSAELIATQTGSAIREQTAVSKEVRDNLKSLSEELRLSRKN